MARALSNYVDRKIRRSTEVKWYVNSLNSLSPDYTLSGIAGSACIPLAALPIGPDVGQRVGDLIHITGLKVNLLINFVPGVGGANFTTVRCVIVRVHDVESTAPAPGLLPGQILSLGPANNVNAVISPYDGRQWRQWTLIHDAWYNLTYQGGNMQVAVTIDKTLRFDASFVGTTGTSASLGKNAMYMFFVGDVADGSTTNPDVYYSWVVKYTDA
jgi:hypothetical protein